MSVVSKQIRQQVHKRDLSACQNTGSKKHSKTLTIHHVFPRREGGSNQAWNLLTLCRQCHMGFERSKKLKWVLIDLQWRIDALKRREEEYSLLLATVLADVDSNRTPDTLMTAETKTNHTPVDAYPSPP